MAACDVQSISVSNNVNTLSTIENFMQDSAYREMIENSSNYNSRLCNERKLRMPFLDAQTGVAQNHSNLFMSSRQRMPGLQDGQVYSYPAKRWRKKRRQYLLNFLQPKRKEIGDFENFESTVTITSEAPVVFNEDSKDSLGGSSSKDEPISKDSWYYEEMEMQEIEGYDEPDPDSDYDYEDTFSKKRKRRSAGKSSRSTSESPMRRGLKGFGRGRRRGINCAPECAPESDKPYNCDLCGARYKTRPGLTYHYTHSHKDKPQDDDGSLEGPPASPSTQKDKPPTCIPPMPSPGTPVNSGAVAAGASVQADQSSIQGSSTSWNKYQDSYMSASPGSSNASTGSAQGQTSNKLVGPNQSLDFENAPSIKGTGAGTSASADDESSSESDKKDDSIKSSKQATGSKDKANPSPYCDFCLGNEDSNKKAQPEELVSCSDCGRSGHPSCLQFTSNMVISVKKYRWQCIECKCCSICGTSDNDDQLLFCDDCDRGYHMYCLSPPLSAPPDGSWSCKLCMVEFHSK